MNEIRIEKSLRRKIAELFLFLWGIVGLGLSVLVAHEAFRFDFQSHVTETVLFGMIVYILIWIGGLIFFGFFTLFERLDDRRSIFILNVSMYNPDSLSIHRTLRTSRCVLPSFHASLPLDIFQRFFDFFTRRRRSLYF